MIKSITIFLLFSLYFSSLNLKYLKLTKMDITRFAMKLFIWFQVHRGFFSLTAIFIPAWAAGTQRTRAAGLIRAVYGALARTASVRGCPSLDKGKQGWFPQLGFYARLISSPATVILPDHYEIILLRVSNLETEDFKSSPRGSIEVIILPDH